MMPPHNGILFLDELPEFKKNVLELLRQPIENGHISIARASMTVTYPANFILIAAMNPCPCGYFTDRSHQCTCTSRQIQRYRSKISGPLLDRIDIHIDVPAIKYRDIRSPSVNEPSKVIKKRVDRTREIQQQRFATSGIKYNAQMTNRHIKEFCTLDNDSHSLLEMAVDKLGFSARAFTRIMKVARTIADLEECPHIQSSHVAEAIQYRSLDRKVFS